LTNIERAKTVARSQKNISKLNFDLFFANDKEGIKAWEKAPSAKILLNRLGSLKATKKISEYIFAPRMDAVMTSLAKPKILDVNMPVEFVKKAFIIKIIISVWYFKP